MEKGLLLCGIMVKNEEERITKTIQTIKDYICYLVILDTGSTDKTCEVIEDYCKKENIKLKLYREEFVDFAYSRNQLLGYCQGLSEFIILLDSNEEVLNANVLVKYLRKTRYKKKKSLFQCNYYWENDSNILGNNVRYNRICVIRNNIPKIKYIYPVHEIIVGPKELGESIDLLSTKLCIYQNRMNDKPSDYRFKRDAEVLSKYLDADGENARIYRYLCQSYKNLKDWENTYRISQRFIKYVEDNNFSFSPDIFYGYLSFAQASYYTREGSFEEHFIKAHNYHKKYIETCEAYYELTVAYYMEKNYEKAYEYIKKACSVDGSRINKIPEAKETMFKRTRFELYMEICFIMDRMDEYTNIKNKLINKKLYSQANDPLYRYATNSRNSSIISAPNKNINLPDNVKLPENISIGRKLPTKDELIQKTQGYKLCILVSYRNRESQLEIFLEKMFSYCSYLGIEFHIYILNQNDNQPFNKGLLYNVGVKLLENDADRSFLCFHDIGTIPTKGTNYYKPDDNEINHLYGHLQTLGGVLLINYEDYISMNGFSNKYEDWGYEDNDFYRRAIKNGIKINNDFFYERYDKHCFEELDQDKEDPIEEMGSVATKKNKRLFDSDIKPEDDGLSRITIAGSFITKDEFDFCTIINIDTSQITIE